MMVDPIPKAPKAASKPGRMRRTSVKNAALEAVYVKNRAIILAQHPVCQRCTVRPSSHVHHVLPRSAGGGHELHNLLALCDGPFYDASGVVMGCHFEVHAAPVDAYREGWMRRKHPKPGDRHYVAEVGE